MCTSSPDETGIWILQMKKEHHFEKEHSFMFTELFYCRLRLVFKLDTKPL